MYLTLTFGISDEKNDDGQGRTRRLSDKSEKGMENKHRLSNRKKTILLKTASAFSRAYQRIVAWGMANWDKIPFTFPLADKEGEPVLDKDGEQKMGLTSAHYLANWLSTRVSISDLDFHSRLANGVRNQAAETLLSQYQLRQMEKNQPRRLTGQVGEVKERSFNRRELADCFKSAVREIADPETESGRLEELAKVVSSSLEPRFVPVLFPGPDDFLLFRHSESKRTFVCLPLLSRASNRLGCPPGVVIRNGRPLRLPDKLVPLRTGEDIKVPNSRQWDIFPLEHQRTLPHQRNAEEMLADPEISPRTAELRLKNGAWRFNIVVKVPEPEPVKPQTYLGVHIGFYSIFWALADEHGQVFKEGEIDQTRLKNLVIESTKERSRARARMRSDRFPKYRGSLKAERERTVREILALAKDCRAAIGIEDISGVDKSTWVGKVNLLRSHWDFGKVVDLLTYRSVLAGLPVVGRKRKREMFRISSFRMTFTCSACWFTNVGKPERDWLVALEDSQIYCGNCNRKTDRHRNAARVAAAETHKFFTAKRK